MDFGQLASYQLTDEDLVWMQAFDGQSLSSLQGALLSQSDPHRRMLLEQVIRRLKVNDKWPFLKNHPSYFLPPGINLEQSSSEFTARYKSDLFHGDRFLDLTGGMGMDAFWISRHFKRGVLVEPNQELAERTASNLKLLGAGHLHVYAGVSAEDWLGTNSDQFDLIYLDPSRRTDQGKKVFKLEEYTPRVDLLLNELMPRCQTIAFKTSPLLDIQSVIQLLPQISAVHILTVHQECRELLFVIQKNARPGIRLVCASYESDGWRQLTFTKDEEAALDVETDWPRRYLYEPNASIMKSGMFKLLTQKYGTPQLHPHTHLFTSDQLHHDFPGRIFQVDAILKVNVKEVQHYLPDRKANLSLRNFPGKQADLKKILRIADGGDQYLWACTLQDASKRLLLCKKINPDLQGQD